jgi:hypothetical protein
MAILVVATSCQRLFRLLVSCVFMNMVRGQTYILRGRHDGGGEKGNDGESHIKVLVVWFELVEGEEVV